MSWFRRSKVSSGVSGPTKSADDLSQPREVLKPSDVALPSKARTFLDNALRAYADNWPRLGGVVDQRIEDFVRLRTAETIREWYTVEDQEWDRTNPPVTLYSSAGPGLVQEQSWGELVQADVEEWAEYWRFKAVSWKEDETTRYIRSDEWHRAHGVTPHKLCTMAEDHALSMLDTIPHDGPDAATQHRQRYVELGKLKEQYERGKKYMDMMRRLEEAAATPIDYECSDESPEVDERSMYSEFSMRLRENGLDESTVFDLLGQLSALVQQSRAILRKLTPQAAKQFEARVLLSYRKKLEEEAYQRFIQQSEQDDAAERQKREREATELAAAASMDQLRQVTDQLTSLNATAANQAHDVATIKWLDIIDGLLGH